PDPRALRRGPDGMSRALRPSRPSRAETVRPRLHLQIRAPLGILSAAGFFASSPRPRPGDPMAFDLLFFHHERTLLVRNRGASRAPFDDAEDSPGFLRRDPGVERLPEGID